MKQSVPVGAAVLFWVVLQVTGSFAVDLNRLSELPGFGMAISGKIAPPVNDPVKQNAVPITPKTVLKEVDHRIRALFDRAADPSTHLVTRESADKAGVGYFVDNFDQIDRDRDGSLRFSEVKGFLDPQSPIERPVSTEIQIIE